MFFSGNKKEIKKLSEFLEYDIEDIVLSNLHKKINSNRITWKRWKDYALYQPEVAQKDYQAKM